MKKILTLFAVVGLIAFSSCEGPEGPPGEPGLSPQAFEIRNVNLSRVTDTHYELSSSFNSEVGGDLYDDESVLIYRMTGTINSNTPVWQLIPRTLYLDNGNELDYDYDFSKVDFVIYADGTYNLAGTPNLIQNQTFRIVIIPSDLLASVNKNNYLEVMKAAKLSENQIQNVNF